MVFLVAVSFLSGDAVCAFPLFFGALHVEHRVVGYGIATGPLLHSLEKYITGMAIRANATMVMALL